MAFLLLSTSHFSSYKRQDYCCHVHEHSCCCFFARMLPCSALWCCLLPCAKVPAPGRRLDVVPDIVPHAYSLAHAWLLPPVLMVLERSGALPQRSGSGRMRKPHRSSKKWFSRSKNSFFHGWKLALGQHSRRWWCLLLESLAAKPCGAVHGCKGSPCIWTPFWRRSTYKSILCFLALLCTYCIDHITQKRRTWSAHLVLGLFIPRFTN